MKNEVMIVTGAGQLSLAIARIMGYGEKIKVDLYGTDVLF